MNEVYALENAIVVEGDKEYRHEGVDAVTFFLENPTMYRHFGYKRINNVVWHWFEYTGPPPSI